MSVVTNQTLSVKPHLAAKNASLHQSMDRGLGHGVHDWSEEGIDEEEESPIALRRLRRRPSPSPVVEPIRISAARSPPSPSPRPWLNWIFGTARSPPPPPGSGILSARTEPPPPGPGPRRNPVPQSVRTRRRSPRSPGGGGDSSGGGVSLLRGWNARLFGTSRGRQEEEPDFSFPPLELPPPDVADAAQVLDLFVAAQTPRTTNARREFLEATMGATTAAASRRTEKMKNELLLNRKVLDLVSLELWLRRDEALAELAWFTELCSGGGEKTAPPLDLFECAFQALENASSDDLHHGADARRFWIGSVAVPEFFLCPISKTIMENPVVITSGKTVDRSQLLKWWRKSKRLCPVTGDALTHSVFIPDILTSTCISQWRHANSITDLTTTAATTTDHPAAAISGEEEALFMEVTVLADSPRSSKEAIRRLHDLISQENCSHLLHLLGHSSGTVAKLAGILPETCLDPDPELDDMILKIMAKVASHGPNKDVLGDDRYLIPVLIARALLGPTPARSKCAGILGELAGDNYYNKIKIGELGAFAPLMELLSIGDTDDVKRTAAMAIASLCEAQENLSRFVREGVADAAIALMREDGRRLGDEAYSMLLQAEGFQLAMEDVMEKLMALGRDDDARKMIDRLWVTFIRSKPGRRRRTSFTPWLSSSLAGKNGMKDVEAIVSWLQMRAYYPRTYRYRH